MNKLLFLIFFGGVFCQVTYAQDHPYFEGTVSYKVDLKGAQAEILKENQPNTQLVMHIKDGSYISMLKGGENPKTFIFVADSNWEYSVNFSAKVVYKHSRYTDRLKEQIREKKARPKVAATGQVGIVNGIECDIYRVKVDQTYFTYYVSDEYRINPELFPKNIRARPFFLVKGLDGKIPLKVEKKQKGLTVTQTVTKITPQNFSPKQFLIPEDFKFKMRDYRH